MCPRTDLTGDLHVVADRRSIRPSPVSAASAQCLPMRQLCPICTRLSIFVPSPIVRAAGLRAVDARVRADFDVIVEHDVADLRNSFETPVDERPAEAFASDHASGVQHDAIADAGSAP